MDSNQDREAQLEEDLRKAFCEAGFTEAFEVLWLHHFMLLRRLAWGRGLKEDRADDLLQNTGMKLFRYLSGHVVEHFPASAVKICRDEVSSFYRTQYRLPAIESLEELLTMNIEPEAEAPSERFERWVALQKKMQDLDIDPKQQTAVILHYLVGYTLKEVAHITGSDPEAVKSRLRYAKAKMGQARRAEEAT